LDQCDSPSVPIGINRDNLNRFSENLVGCKLFRLIAEGLVPFWGVNSVEPDFDFLFVMENGNGVAVGNADDLGVV
jgi:hypothetical protein